FGLPIDQALQLIERIRASRRLRLDGVHVHVGSQIMDVDTLARAVEVVAGLGAFDVYDLGGGLGARCPIDEPAPSVAESAGRVGGGERYDLVGHHCESGDRLIEGVVLDAPQVDDLVVLPVTGAYCYTMANNYNGALRPPVLFCRDGQVREVVRRETYEDLLAR